MLSYVGSVLTSLCDAVVGFISSDPVCYIFYTLFAMCILAIFSRLLSVR